MSSIAPTDEKSRKNIGPDNSLDIPSPSALIGKELLSERKYERLEGVSLSLSGLSPPLLLYTPRTDSLEFDE
jgi:hypothetical protein